MLNKVILMGRLTADPEHKQTPSGVSVTSFSIAVERNFEDKSTGKRQADFINIVAWRQTADFICKYFSKGRMIALEGSLQARNYEDKQGNKRTAVEVVADHAYFADSKQAEDKPPASSMLPGEPPPSGNFSMGDFEEIDTDDSDLPF